MFNILVVGNELFLNLIENCGFLEFMHFGWCCLCNKTARRTRRNILRHEIIAKFADRLAKMDVIRCTL